MCSRADAVSDVAVTEVTVSVAAPVWGDDRVVLLVSHIRAMSVLYSPAFCLDLPFYTACLLSHV
jgi:hypothetical protein